MFRAFFIAIVSCVVVTGSTSCSSPHVFPRLKPLFVGLDESALNPVAKRKLAKAKTDFQCVRTSGKPFHAQDSGRVPHSKTRKFVGDGYEITMVDSWAGFVHSHGPKICIQPSITGGKAYHYDEVEVCND